MNRRTILQLTGASIATGSATRPAASTQEGGTATDTPEGSSCRVDIRFGERELVVEQGGVVPTAYARVVVENAGDVASGQISLTASWLDDSGSMLDDDTATLPSLGGGETWLGHVEALVTDPTAINEVEVTGDFAVGQPRTPRGLSVDESEFDRANNSMTGMVANSRDAPLGQVEAHAKLYDAEGRVLGGATALETDLPAGQNWRFEAITPRLPAAVEPADHSVSLDGRAFQIQG